jgi:hypothetical protein
MLDAEALAYIQQVAQEILTDDLKTEVTVLRRTRAAENAYGTSAETWTADQTYLGWLENMKSRDLAISGGQVANSEEFELRLPIDAIVSPGDRVLIGGVLFTVQNTNNEDTLPVFMEAIVRRVE